MYKKVIQRRLNLSRNLLGLIIREEDKILYMSPDKMHRINIPHIRKDVNENMDKNSTSHQRCENP